MTPSESCRITWEAPAWAVSDFSRPGGDAGAVTDAPDFAAGSDLGRGLNSGSGMAINSDRSIVANGDVEARK